MSASQWEINMRLQTSQMARSHCTPDGPCQRACFFFFFYSSGNHWRVGKKGVHNMNLELYLLKISGFWEDTDFQLNKSIKISEEAMSMV